MAHDVTRPVLSSVPRDVSVETTVSLKRSLSWETEINVNVRSEV